MRSNPWVVGIVNAVVPGLGYVLIGERKTFGWLLLTGSLCCIILAFIEPAFMTRTFLASTTNLGKLFESLWYLLFLLAYGYDAYSLARAKRHTAQLPVVQTGI